jgi:hypothetical protein
LGLQGPKTLNGVTRPEESELLAGLSQLRDEPQASRMRSELGLGVSDGPTLIAVIEKLWPGTIPELADADAACDLPLDWMAALLQLGVRPRDALAWWRLDPDMLPRLAANAIKDGLSSADVARFMDFDMDADLAIRLLTDGCSVEKWEEYHRLLITPWDAANFFEAGVGPSEAKSWIDHGVNGLLAFSIKNAGYSVADLRAWEALGIDDARFWMAEGIDLETTRVWREARTNFQGYQVKWLSDAGIDPATAMAYWRRGVRRPATIIERIKG